MGKSKTIEEQSKQNQSFQEYLDELSKRLKTRCEADSKSFDADVERFYKNSELDSLTIAEGEKWDFQQIHEFGLGNVAALISNTVDSVFGSHGNEDVTKAVQNLTDYKKMAIAVATNLIAAAMDAFKVVNSVTYNHSYVAEAVCPGLTLHLLVANDSYKDSRWLQNDSIVENYVKYRLIFSYKKFGMESDIPYLNAHLASIEKFSGNLTLMDDKLADMLADLTISDQVIDSYTNRIDRLRKQLETARTEIKKIIDSHISNKILAASGSLAALPEGLSRERIALRNSILDRHSLAK